MDQLIWSETAIRDLNSIAEYIAVDSEYAAQKFVQELINKANILLLHPGKGRPIPEDIPGNYRQKPHKSYRIIIKYAKEILLFPQFIIKKNYYSK